MSELPSWRRQQDPRTVAMQRVQADLLDTPPVGLEVMVERGQPAQVILETAEQLGCDLIVTGVAHDETLGQLLLGSTVETVVRHSRAPVLVVKSRPRRPYRSVVVATDFSEGARDALVTALDLLPTAQVSLFHAFDVPFEGHMNDKMEARRAMARQAQEEGAAFLEATAAVAASGRHVEAFYEYGEASELLQDLVQAQRADLVVLGTEGRSGLAHMLLGSVAAAAAQPLDG